MQITSLHAREVLDSRGNPTVEVELTIDQKFTGRAIVPSGASTGTHEVLELRDHDESRYHGQGVKRAVKNVKDEISRELIGKDFSQAELDRFLLQLDGTENKSRLGANALLGVSLAFAWSLSQAEGKQLYEYIGEIYGNSHFILPRPMMNIMNGGKHANWATDIQEYMILPVSNTHYGDKLRMGSEIFYSLEKVLEAKGYSTNVGNEGGFAPQVQSNQEAIDLILLAIEKAGYKLGEDVKLGFDAAASEFFNKETKMYDLKRDGTSLTSSEMVDWTLQLTKAYPVISLEDMLAEDDWQGWSELTNKVDSSVQVVGDDLLVTNVKRIQQAIEQKACNALLVKVNQIGTLTEALEAMKMSQNAGWNNVVSHRSGETEDVTIAHIAVGTGCGQIKTGAPSRGERTAKYNELLRIEERVGS